MPALRTLGLVIISVFAITIGILGVVSMMAALDERSARESALRVSNACGTVIATGNTQNVEISIPSNYQIRFVDNKISVDSYMIPEGGFAFRFEDGSPDLGPGTHNLSITIRNGRLVVTRI